MANQELLQKLRRQRLRMGENDVPTETAVHASVASHTPSRTVQELHRGDLQSKLNRQRQRIGESDVEKAQQVAYSIDSHSHVKVKQRAMKFQGRTTSGPTMVKQPGRLNIGTWEDRCRVPVGASVPRGSVPDSGDAHDLIAQNGYLLESGSNLATIAEEGKRPEHMAFAEEVSNTFSGDTLEISSDHGDASSTHDEEEHPQKCLELDACDDVLKDVEEHENEEVKTGKGPEIECFYMWDSDDETCSLQEESISERQRNKEAEEPLEFSMLDYLAQLPEGVAEKLHSCLKTHEELVRRLCQRNDLLRAHIRNLRREASEVRPSPHFTRSHRSPQSPQATVPSTKPSVPSSRRRPLVDSSKLEAKACSERVRLRDEQQEANLRARLQRTIRASRERVQAMQRRVEREEQQVKHRFEVALQTRDGLERSIKAALKEQSFARLRIGELEEAVNVESMRFRSKEKERDQMQERQNSLRNEIKVLRSRALKHQQRERRIQDLQCELEAYTKTYHSESPRWTL